MGKTHAQIVKRRAMNTNPQKHFTDGAVQVCVFSMHTLSLMHQHALHSCTSGFMLPSCNRCNWIVSNTVSQRAIKWLSWWTRACSVWRTLWHMDSTTLVLCYSALEMKLGWYGTRWYGTVWDGMGWYGTCFTALSQMQQITEIFWATQNKISRKVTNKRD